MNQLPHDYVKDSPGDPLPGTRCRFCEVSRSKISPHGGECPARLRSVLNTVLSEGGVPVSIQLIGPNHRKVVACRAVRLKSVKALDYGLQEAMAIIEAAIDGQPASTWVRGEVLNEFMEEMMQAGFQVTVGPPKVVSPQAQRVLTALEAKPQLLAEVRSLISFNPTVGVSDFELSEAAIKAEIQAEDDKKIAKKAAKRAKAQAAGKKAAATRAKNKAASNILKQCAGVFKVKVGGPQWFTSGTHAQATAVDNGDHPTGRQLAAGTTATCGDCKFAVRTSGNMKTYYKCEKDKANWTNSGGSDIKLKWQACIEWVQGR